MKPMTGYRWNVPDFAQGYDEAAQHIHPHYREMQQQVIDHLPAALAAGGLVVDAGGGSGRLIEQVLTRFPQATAVVVDQSEAFLGLAERRLHQFEGRASQQLNRLQDDWLAALPEAPLAIVSMSAIHHLDPSEKQHLYQQCAAALRPGGMLLNGDEIYNDSEADYKACLSSWAAHMQQMMDGGQVPQSMHKILHSWRERNVDRYGEPKASGDDCHETIAAQLTYFSNAGLAPACVWSRDMWAVMKGAKPESGASSDT